MKESATSGSKRLAVGRLRAEGKSYREISNRLGLSKATIAYHARRLGIEADDRAARRYDWAAVQETYDAGLSVRDCAQKFGFCLASWHAAVARGDVKGRPARLPTAELLVDGRTGTNRGDLKRRLIEEGLKEERCEQCGLSLWRGEPLSPQLHHRNGRKYDNRLENRQLLCPNCHSQTDNWGGRNARRCQRREDG